MSEKYLIHSRLTKVNSLYVFGHEIVIGYVFFSNKLQIPMAGDRALRGGGVRASDWLSKGRRFESRLRRFFTPTPAESLPFLTPPLAETVN